MHRPIPAALILALARELSPDSLMGRWRADIGTYDFSPNEAIVTIARTGKRHVLRIRSIEVRKRTIVVNWADDGSHTSFGRFTRHSMTQLSETLDGGRVGPERTFHRCP